MIPLIFILSVSMENKVFEVFLVEPVSDIAAVTVTVTVFLPQFRKMLENGPFRK